MTDEDIKHLAFISIPNGSALTTTIEHAIHDMTPCSLTFDKMDIGEPNFLPALHFFGPR
jgi:hypothetical protein